MPLTAGIVGLPNIGKSTLFNALTMSEAEVKNYPFATVAPNMGVVIVPDERLDNIAGLIKPQKKINTTVELTDIAGLVSGASKGEGLGNQFLKNIREVDAIVHVVRCFEDRNISHIDDEIDPIRDIEIINLELIFSDLDQIERRLQRIEKQAKMKEEQILQEQRTLIKIKEGFEEGISARLLGLTEEEEESIKHMQLLTMKPVLYVANIGEEDIIGYERKDFYKKMKDFTENEKAELIVLCAKIEAELTQLDDESREMFLEDIGITESGLDQMIRATYSLLGLATYFTAGPKEVRAWTFKKGMKAPQCAGVIHSDFERGFIRAATMHYDDFMEYGSEAAVKEAGKMRLEGKEYVVKDGDIIHFRFNV